MFHSRSVPPTGAAAGHSIRFARVSIVAALVMMVVLTAATAMPAGAAGKKRAKKPDRKAPYVTKALTDDLDSDGQIDQIVITYSEPVRLRKYRGTAAERARQRKIDLKARARCLKVKQKKRRVKCLKRLRVAAKVDPLTVPGRKVKKMTLLAGRKQLRIDLVESGVPDTGVKVRLGYRKAAPRRKALLDRAGNQALAGIRAVSDGAPPVLIGAATRDDDVNGAIDGIGVTFSEDVKTASAAGFAVGGRTVTGADVVSGDAVARIAQGAADTDARPAVAVAAGAVEDAVGNALKSAGSATPADAAGPVVTGGVTRDANANGRIERIDLSFSEPINHAAELGGATSVTVTGYTTLSVGAASGNAITVQFGEGGATDTGYVPSITINTGAAPITDAAGNGAPAVGGTGTIVDGAAPVLISARTADLDVDGKIDGLKAVFSEAVAGAPGAGGFSLQGGAPITSPIDPVTVTGSAVLMTIAEAGSPNGNLPTAGSPITLTYTAGGGVADARANPAADGTVNAADGVGPAIVGAQTGDTDHDGRIDRVTVTFSETINKLTGSPVTVADGMRVVTASSAIGATLTLTTTEITSDYDGEETPFVEYDPVAGTSLVDLSNNPPFKTGVPFTGTTDGAEPILLSATVYDLKTGASAGADGLIDELQTLWSEPVTAVDTSGPSAGLALTPPRTVTVTPSSANPVVTAQLAPGTNPDRDSIFQVRYAGLAPSPPPITDAAGNGAWTYPDAPERTATANCQDPDDDDDQRSISSFPLEDQTGGGNIGSLATLCGADVDWYRIDSVPASAAVNIVFAPAAAGVARSPVFEVRNGVTGSDVSDTLVSVTPTTSPGIWRLSFTADPAGGTYAVKVVDSTTPVVDYGYCMAVRLDGFDPNCGLRPSDLTITEVLRDPTNASAVGRFVELENTSGRVLTVGSDPDLNVLGDLAGARIRYNGASLCELRRYSDTLANSPVPYTIPIGGRIYVSTGNDLAFKNDFQCVSGPVTDGTSAPFSTSFSYDLPVELRLASGGLVDQVSFFPAETSAGRSLQLRDAPSALHSSTGNDDIGAGWCSSINVDGTPGAANGNCDDLRIEEVAFPPLGSTRDGRVFVELRGNGSLRPSSTLLGGWRVRIRPGTVVDPLDASYFITLPATATTDASGLYVLADQPNSGGATYVSRYSSQIPGLDALLRVDQAMSVQLLPPRADPQNLCAADAVDSFGYLPVIGSSFGTPSDACGALYIGTPFSKPSYPAGQSPQRQPGKDDSTENLTDYCIGPVTPMIQSYSCNIII